MGVGRPKVNGHPEQDPVREALLAFIYARPGRCWTHQLRAAAAHFGVHENTIWGWMKDTRPIPAPIAEQLGYRLAWVEITNHENVL